MRNITMAKIVFQRYGGIMRTSQLAKEKIYYADIRYLLEKKCIDKIRTGYYQWNSSEKFNEAYTVGRIFSDGIFCMDTALRYYWYSDRNPREWHIAVSKYSNRTRFNLDYPFVRPYYIDPKYLELGLTERNLNGGSVRIYDKERVICDCLRRRNRMDREQFNKAIRGYVNDPGKDIPKLMEYAKQLKAYNLAKSLIDIWL